jgi:hypothetical protein
MKEVNIHNTFALGNASEAKVKGRLENQGWIVEKKDHKLFPYDFDITMGDKVKHIEIKTYGHPSYTTLFAETKQISKVNRIETIPEYILHKDEIDYIIWVDRFKNTARVFNNKIFAEYVLSKMGEERYNSYGTGAGVLIEQDCIEAGLKYVYVF